MQAMPFFILQNVVIQFFIQVIQQRNSLSNHCVHFVSTKFQSILRGRISWHHIVHVLHSPSLVICWQASRLNAFLSYCELGCCKHIALSYADSFHLDKFSRVRCVLQNLIVLVCKIKRKKKSESVAIGVAEIIRNKIVHQFDLIWFAYALSVYQNLKW